jgi:recombination associated protein RdgC
MFKNATFFRFAPAVGMDVLCRLDEAIALLPLRELEPHERGTSGFIGEPLTFWIGSMCYTCVAVRERIISPKHVNELLEKQVKQRAYEDGRNIGGRERKRMREEIIVALMPHAPIVTKRFDCLIHCGENWIAINTGSANAAEHSVNMIRAALGSFPARFLSPQSIPRTLLTELLREHGPEVFGLRPTEQQFAKAGWSLGGNCKLKGEDESAVSYTHQSMYDTEIADNLEAGKHVKQLGVVIREHVQATITTDLVLKSIKFLDASGTADAEDHQQILALQALELEIVARDLFALFQCEEPSDEN